MYISKPNWTALKARKKKLDVDHNSPKYDKVLGFFRKIYFFFKRYIVGKYYYWFFLFIGIVFSTLPNLTWIFQKPVPPDIEFGSDLVLFEEDDASPLTSMTDDGFIQKYYVPTTQSDRKRLTDVIEYQIQKGDSLSKIAAKFGVSQRTIVDSNNLSSSSLLRVGSTLTIIPIDGILYTVKKNDKLPDIAKTYKANIDDILRQNKLASKEVAVAPGTRLIIPGGVKPVPPAPPKKPVSAVATLKSGKAAQTIQSKSSISADPSKVVLSSPVQGGVLTQGFSYAHQALDIASKGGAKIGIYAAASGVVVGVGGDAWNGGYGNYVKIDHGDGVVTLYAHNSAVLVKVGDTVKGGQFIAKMGNTGRTHGITGVHLHFEVTINGKRYNPANYIK